MLCWMMDRLTSQTCTGHKSLQKQCNQWAGRASLDLPDQNDKRHTTTLLVVATLHDVNNRTNVRDATGKLSSSPLIFPALMCVS